MPDPWTPMLLIVALTTGPMLVCRPLAPVLGAWARDLRFLARMGTGLFLVAGSVLHVFYGREMVAMLPDWVPARLAVVYLTGFWEIALVIALFAPRLTRIAGLLIALTFLLFLPANVFAAVERIPLAGHDYGPGLLWARIPLQLVMAGWALWATGWLRQTARPVP